MDVSILVTSDIHGHINGLSSVAAYLKNKRKNGENFIFLDNGDFLEGSLLSSYLYMQRNKWDTNPLIDILNQLGAVAAVPGNHEFNFGMDYLNKCVSAMQCPYLAANIIDEKNNSPYFKPYTIIEKDDMKMGIIGLITDYIPRWEHAGHVEGLKFVDPVQSASYWAQKIRKDVDIVLLAYHGGIERDLETGLPTEYQTGENVGYRLAAEIPFVDGIITGHQHKTLAGHVGNIPILQPGTAGSHIGEMTFTLEKNHHGKWTVLNTDATLIDLSGYPKDMEMLAHIQDWTRASDAWQSTSLNQLLAANQRHMQDTVQILHTIQSTMSNEIISGVSLYDRVNDAVDLDMNQIVRNFTFPNTFAVLRMTGASLREALKRSAAIYQVDEQGQLTPFKKENHHKGNMWLGLDYQITADKDIAYLNKKTGEPIESDTVITLVCNHYKQLPEGKRIFTQDMIIHEYMIYLPDLFVTYLSTGQMVIPVQTHQYQTLQ